MGSSTLLHVILTPGAPADEPEPATQPGELPLGRETTFITEPLNEDGTPNYVAWLNEKYGQGVTPENNAAVLLVRVFGPEWLAEDVREESLKRLGIDEIPEDAGLFRSAFDYLGESFAEDDYVAVRSGPWSRSDYPDMARWLDANEQAFVLLEEASRRSRYYAPLVSAVDPASIHGVLMPRLGLVREAARALVARAMLRIGAGEYVAAWADAMTAVRLGCLLQTDPLLITNLVGIATEGTGMEPAVAVLAKGNLTVEQLRGFQQELGELHQVSNITRYNQSNRFAVLDCVMQIYRPFFILADEMFLKKRLNLCLLRGLPRLTNWREAEPCMSTVFGRCFLSRAMLSTRLP